MHLGVCIVKNHISYIGKACKSFLKFILSVTNFPLNFFNINSFPFCSLKEMAISLTCLNFVIKKIFQYKLYRSFWCFPYSTNMSPKTLENGATILTKTVEGAKKYVSPMRTEDRGPKIDSWSALCKISFNKLI